MFHSIYGTEMFQGFTLPLERRDEVRALIGDRAERLAYLNCAMDRASFDRALDQAVEPYRFTDRITGEEVQLSQHDFDDLCRVHLFDWLEQVPRSRNWDYRRAAYRKMAERLGERRRKSTRSLRPRGHEAAVQATDSRQSTRDRDAMLLQDGLPIRPTYFCDRQSPWQNRGQEDDGKAAARSAGPPG